MTTHDKNASEEERISTLVKLAGRRTEIPAEMQDRLESSFRQELDTVRKHRTMKRRMSVSIAASFLVGIVSFYVFTTMDSTSESIAVVIRSMGHAELRHATDGVSPLSVQYSIASDTSGSVLSTGPRGRVLLAMTGSKITLRMDTLTQLKIVDQHEVELIGGTIYIDTGAGGDSHGDLLSVHSRNIEINHTGTQYMVTGKELETIVAVREGSVSVRTPRQSLESHAMNGTGQLVRISSDFEIAEYDIETSGDQWKWIQSIASEFETDKASLIDFLGWVSRETGRPLRFDSELAREGARTTRLVGSIQGFDPEVALAAILSTTRFVVKESTSNEILITNVSSPNQ